MSKRYIALPAINKKVTLGQYITAIKTAKAHLEDTFPYGLSCWYSCTGQDIMNQFMEGIMDRINQGIPYTQRGQTQ